MGIPEPPRGDHPQKMAAGKNQHVAGDGPGAIQNAIRPRGDLSGGFTAGAAITKDLPAGASRLNLRQFKPFEIAIIPLDQIMIHHGSAAEAGKFTGAGGALQGTRENFGEADSAQPFPQFAGIAFAMRGQRQIRQSRVLARKAPGRFAMPCEIDDWKRIIHVGLLCFTVWQKVGFYNHK